MIHIEESQKPHPYFFRKIHTSHCGLEKPEIFGTSTNQEIFESNVLWVKLLCLLDV
jgi:hypothetical protein